MLTADEFEAAWRAENQVTLEAWDLVGFRVVPCRCGVPRCPGWRVTLPEDRPTTRLQRLSVAFQASLHGGEK